MVADENKPIGFHQSTDDGRLANLARLVNNDDIELLVNEQWRSRDRQSGNTHYSSSRDTLSQRVRRRRCVGTSWRVNTLGHVGSKNVMHFAMAE